jgi:hypothetical protein
MENPNKFQEYNEIALKLKIFDVKRLEFFLKKEKDKVYIKLLKKLIKNKKQNNL